MIEHIHSFVCGGLAVVLLLVLIIAVMRYFTDSRKYGGDWFVVDRNNEVSVKMKFHQALTYLATLDSASYMQKSDPPYKGCKIYKDDPSIRMLWMP